MSEIHYHVNRECLLKRFPGKGGWTYIEIPEIAPDSKNPFGWVRVSGLIDNHTLSRVKLMPMGDGTLFLPVKTAIRKSIGKQAGDQAVVKLYIENTPSETPDELVECLSNESAILLERFNDLPRSKRQSYIDWIYDAKNDDIKAERIVRLIEDLTH